MKIEKKDKVILTTDAGSLEVDKISARFESKSSRYLDVLKDSLWHVVDLESLKVLASGKAVYSGEKFYIVEKEDTLEIRDYSKKLIAKEKRNARSLFSLQKIPEESPYAKPRYPAARINWLCFSEGQTDCIIEKRKGLDTAFLYDGKKKHQILRAGKIDSSAGKAFFKESPHLVFSDPGKFDKTLLNFETGEKIEKIDLLDQSVSFLNDRCPFQVLQRIGEQSEIVNRNLEVLEKGFLEVVDQNITATWDKGQKTGYLILDFDSQYALYLCHLDLDAIENFAVFPKTATLKEMRKEAEKMLLARRSQKARRL